jgi:hypothetical protein
MTWDQGEDPYRRFVDTAEDVDLGPTDLDTANKVITELADEVNGLTEQRDSARRWAVQYEGDARRYAAQARKANYEVVVLGVVAIIAILIAIGVIPWWSAS